MDHVQKRLVGTYKALNNYSSCAMAFSPKDMEHSNWVLGGYQERCQTEVQFMRHGS